MPIPQWLSRLNAEWQWFWAGATGDSLLDMPFLSKSEIQGLLDDIRGMQSGTPNIVGSDFWNRAMADVNRRQVVLQLQLNHRMFVVTCILTFATVCLALASF
jgi:hypothetical protein